MWRTIPFHRRDFPHLHFSLNGGIQNANEAKAAVLYTGPWPTPGHVEMRMQHLQTIQPPPKTDGVEAGGGEGEEEGGGPQEGRGANAACGIGGDCVGGDDGLPMRSTTGAEREGLLAGSSPAGAGAAPAGDGGETPLCPSCVPVREEDGMIEGVMIGRAAYNDPWGCLGDADRAIFGEARNPCSNRREASEETIVMDLSFRLKAFPRLH